MKTYWLLFKLGMQNMMIYRFNFFSWFFTESISVLIMAYIWLSVYQEGNVVANYSLSDMIIYYVISRLVGMVVMTEVADKINTDIMQGRLINNMLKPLNYLKSIFASNMGEMMLSIALQLPFVIILAIIFKHYLVFDFIRISLFFVALIAAALIYFLIMTIIGMLSFYFDNIFGILFFVWLLFALFAGRMVPLDLLPPSVLLISNWLPFRFTTFVPVQILSGKISIIDSYYAIFYSFIWIAVLVISNKVIFKRGIKKYEGYGI
ncbi:MAG: ABC-2 family transporter protein [bacterium]